MRINYLLSLLGLMLLSSCFFGCDQKEETLPILGRRELEEKTINGEKVIDTVYHSIEDFQFLDQDSVLISQNTFSDKVYVSDFFFTTCPTICPVMKGQMMRVYDSFYDQPEVLFLSHTIDPEHDSVAVLREYAEQLGVESHKWHFVTGDKETIYETAQTSYYATAAEDELEPGGFIHSGAFILVDKQRHIRGIYDGTDPEAVDRLIADINILLKEYQD